MSDITLCAAYACDLAKTCKRHPDSGTEAGAMQSFADWSAELTWTPDSCRGHWPKVATQPRAMSGGAVYRGRW